MPTRFQLQEANALLLSSDVQTYDPLPSVSETRRRPSPAKVWVDPANLPNYHHHSSIAGNAPDYAKQLNYNTYMCYGVGEPDAFGYTVGKAVKFVEVNVNRKMDRKERLEATTVAEIEVTKRTYSARSNLWLRID